MTKYLISSFITVIVLTVMVFNHITPVLFVSVIILFSIPVVLAVIENLTYHNSHK